MALRQALSSVTAQAPDARTARIAHVIGAPGRMAQPSRRIDPFAAPLRLFVRCRYQFHSDCLRRFPASDSFRGAGIGRIDIAGPCARTRTVDNVRSFRGGAQAFPVPEQVPPGQYFLGHSRKNRLARLPARSSLHRYRCRNCCARRIGTHPLKSSLAPLSRFRKKLLHSRALFVVVIGQPPHGPLSGAFSGSSSSKATSASDFSRLKPVLACSSGRNVEHEGPTSALADGIGRCRGNAEDYLFRNPSGRK